MSKSVKRRLFADKTEIFNVKRKKGKTCRAKVRTEAPAENASFGKYPVQDIHLAEEVGFEPTRAYSTQGFSKPSQWTMLCDSSSKKHYSPKN